MTALAIVFWISVGLVLYAHAGYFLLLWVVDRLRPGRRAATRASAGAEIGELPAVSVIVAAYAEAEVIARRSPTSARSTIRPTLLEVIVACDGSPDDDRRSAPATPAPTSCSSCRAAARSAPRTRPCSARSGEIVAFSDANALWEPDALRRLVAPFADPRVGYVCGQVRFVNERRHQPGGRLLALRDGAARPGVAARAR